MLAQTFRRNLWVLLVPVAAGFAAAGSHGLAWMGKATAVGFMGGLAGGLIAGAIGLITVPLIALILGFPIHQAVATNLVQTIFTAASGAQAHARKGNVNGKLAGVVLVGALIGAPLGAIVGLRLPEVWLRGIFAGALLLMALNLLRRMLAGPGGRARWLDWVEARSTAGWLRPIAGEFRGRSYSVSPAVGVGFGAGIGFVSGLLGIGGGFLVTPLLATLLHVPTRLALGTGLVVIGGNSVFGSVPHALAGNVMWFAAILLSIGGSIGARVGSALSHHVPERVLYGLFLVTLLVVAWRIAP